MHCAENREPGPCAGFTLIEVLVALAVAALGLAVLMAAIGVGLGNARLAERYLEATSRAQSHLAQVGVSLPLSPGEQSGDDGGGFSWLVRISPAAVNASAAEAGTQQPLTLYS